MSKICPRWEKPAAIFGAERARAGSAAVGKILISKRPVLVSVNGILNECFKTTRIKLHRCKISHTKYVYWMLENEKSYTGKGSPPRYRRHPLLSAPIYTQKIIKAKGKLKI